MSRLGRSEKAALRLLRDPHPTAQSFSELRILLDRLNIPILFAGSPFVGPEEARLLDWLAWFQRLADNDTFGDVDELGTALRHCADDLHQKGLRLGNRNLVVASMSLNDSSGNRLPVRIPVIPERQTLRTRILGYVEKQGCVSNRDLQKFGASRQTVSAMHKEGLLLRTGWSRYTLPPCKA